MTSYITDPVSSLLELLPPARSARVVVGLVGLPGAGKSTQARLWAQRVNARANSPVMQTLGMDGFHLRLSELSKLLPPLNDVTRRGAPWTFDAQALVLRLAALRQRDSQGNYKRVLWPDFDHGVGEAIPDAVRIEPTTRLILVEGLYLLLPDPGWNLKNLFDNTWFLDEGMDVAMGRLVRRHCQSWGMSEAEALERIAVNDRRNAEIVDQTRSFAQALVAPARDFQGAD